jgi:demethoxyubiquinone hydroxylase (CLK1/Coq7/Cat5 family)
MIKKIVDTVTEQIKRHLQPQMTEINNKLDNIDNRISNIESYMELQQMMKDFDFLVDKHTDMDDVINPQQTLKPTPTQNRRQGL